MATLSLHRHRCGHDSRQPQPGHTSPKHHNDPGEDAQRGMTSNGPTLSPPRAVVAHRSREDDREREPGHQQQERGGKGDNSRDRRDDRDDRDGRNGRDGKEDRDYRDRDKRGSRDNRGDRDGRRSRKSGAGGSNSHQNRRKRSRERERERGRSRSRDRHRETTSSRVGRDGRDRHAFQKPSSALDTSTAGTSDRGRRRESHFDDDGEPSTGDRRRGDDTGPSSVLAKRPRSPSVSLGGTPGSGGLAVSGSGAQPKRSRLDKSPSYRQPHQPRSGHSRSNSPSPYYHPQHSSSRRLSSRSPLPPSHPSLRRDRRSKNKNKSRNQAGPGITSGDADSQRQSTRRPPFSNRRDSRSSLRPDGGGGSASWDDGFEGGNPNQQALGDRSRSPQEPHTSASLRPHAHSHTLSDTVSRRDRTPDDPSHKPSVIAEHSKSPRDRDRDRNRDSGRDREQGRERDRERDKVRDKGRERERDRERHGRSPRSSKKKSRRRDHSQGSHASGTASAIHSSTDVDMATRGGSYRGGTSYGPYPVKGLPLEQQQQQIYNSQSPHHHDPRRLPSQQHPASHPHPPGHVTPNASFHGSPPPQSPYGGSQGWGPPQGQYPPQYPHTYARSGTPQGPSPFHQSNSPPYGTPTGPSGRQSQYLSSGPSRGTLRGSQYSSGRGSQRNSISNGESGNYNGQWNAGQGAEGGYHPDSPMAPSPHPGNYHRHNQHPQHFEGDDVLMQDSEGAHFQQTPSQYQHTFGTERSPVDGDGDGPSDRDRDSREPHHSIAGDQMPPPSRQPPTGPQSKFSFEFKASSKPTVTAPKAEIAQKLSAAPRQQQAQSRQQQHPQASQQRSPLQQGHQQQPGFPRNAPTEPASSRARSEQQHQQQRQRADQSRGGGGAGNGPRYRKVKKIIRRLKPRRTLTDELAASESVYYRKPGNESVVGSGTYGKVFKAVHVYTKKLVALKRIRMEGEREGLPVTAIREIKLLQSLKHTNVVDLQEVMVEKNDCFMVFEYLSHDLNGLLNHPTFKLDDAQKKHMALQLFQGLDYLHRRGVLHRDIKAANILVSSDGILKLADFGLARFFAKRHQLDYTNRVVTIWYRSPELLLGETQYGPAVDIWSAACVMVEIFTKHAIFPGDGGEISQLEKIFAVLGTPSKSDWPGLVEMPWFELMRPNHRIANNFAGLYENRMTSTAFELLTSMFHYDPAKRPTAAAVLEHPYFTKEEPAPRQAIEIVNIGGDWHEFESKALRRENERKAKEAKKAEATDVSTTVRVDNSDFEKKKRPPPTSAEADGNGKTGDAVQREAKRQHIEAENPESAKGGDEGGKGGAEAEPNKSDTQPNGPDSAAGGPSETIIKAIESSQTGKLRGTEAEAESALAAELADAASTAIAAADAPLQPAAKSNDASGSGVAEAAINANI